MDCKPNFSMKVFEFLFWFAAFLYGSNRQVPHSDSAFSSLTRGGKGFQRRHRVHIERDERLLEVPSLVGNVLVSRLESLPFALVIGRADVLDGQLVDATKVIFDLVLRHPRGNPEHRLYGLLPSPHCTNKHNTHKSGENEQKKAHPTSIYKLRAHL